MLNKISSIFLPKQTSLQTNYVTSIIAVKVSYLEENPFLGNDGMCLTIAICAI